MGLVCLGGRCSAPPSAPAPPPPKSVCGNGLLETGETCDDGNLRSFDGCSARCAAEPIAQTRCGDGIRAGTEECDDGNTRDRDGCSAQCFREGGFCGDDIVQTFLGEECEPSLTDPRFPPLCAANCRYAAPFCGDGVRGPGEECDRGKENSDDLPDRCRLNCLDFRCGDGVLDSAELCDDGNRASGDGCNSSCLREIIPGDEPTVASDIVETQPLPPAPASTVVNTFTYFIGQPTPAPLPASPITATLPTGDAGRDVVPTHEPVGDTGPAALAVMVAGAASGIAWVRRKRRNHSP